MFGFIGCLLWAYREIDCAETYLLYRWYQYSCHKQDPSELW